ncbi:hypothetical protein [Actinokineospora terrae]|uniref:Uncharacterized protein n=1 Tax=Actinokineospora terrae TaxID=155974 RepID=A0A1H9M8N7_9PSEU|nr:hypothetical protein [Actinokineospora terrae]SER19819.1 hypothetical protein SAMN04487818_10212 [Actinokineospora terrae]
MPHHDSAPDPVTLADADYLAGALVDQVGRVLDDQVGVRHRGPGRRAAAAGTR